MVSLVYPTASMPATPPPSRPKGAKRDSSSLDVPNMADLSPSKRLKVAFNDDIDVRYLDEWAPRPQDLVHEEVRVAIDGHLRGGVDRDDVAYDQLRAVFASAALDARNTDPQRQDPDRPGGALLKQYLIALLRRVGDLKGCNTLIYAVLDMNWLGREEKFVTIYVKFLGALGSVIPGFLKHIMEKIVRHFVTLPSVYGRIPNEPVVRRRQMLMNLHWALKYLTNLIPAGADALSEALKAQFPNHRMASRKDYLAYIRNLFKIAAYLPEIRSDIIALVMERLVKIDVEIQEEIEELDEDIDQDVVQSSSNKDNYFLDDDTSDDSDADSDVSSDLEDTAEERQIKDLRDKSSKLDAGMDFLFRHYSSDGGILPDRRTEELDHLLSQFTTFVLPTYRSRHVQFLAFHFAQVDIEKSARFVSRCLNLISGNGSTSSSAVFGSAYLASFLARGARLSRTLVRDVIDYLINRVNALRISYEATARGPDIGRHSPFYSAMQALLYIFCFRWRELLFNSSPHSNLPDDEYDYQITGETLAAKGLRDCLHQAIYSRLNPLKVCSPAIVKQFAAIANHLRYMFVYPLLETNKRVRLSSFRTYGGSTQGGGALAKRDSALSAKSGEAHHQLDAFFPFDPYRLPRSKRWLDGDYNEWKGIEGMRYVDDEDDADEDSDSAEESDDEDDGRDDDVDSDLETDDS